MHACCVASSCDLYQTSDVDVTYFIYLQTLDGRTIRVDKVLPPGERPERPEREQRAPRARTDSPYRIYVGNLPWRFDDYDLEDAFAEFGTVQDAKVCFLCY